jgi:hypothetical protein
MHSDKPYLGISYMSAMNQNLVNKSLVPLGRYLNPPLDLAQRWRCLGMNGTKSQRYRLIRISGTRLLGIHQ